ncbi:MAG: DUF4143 domain-containing protein [Chitinophagaceae bacterium]|nr:DUF4143 domain-containing protein [Chitinophagaceae bacterium]
MGAHLLNHSMTQNFTIHYWREGNNEVDFVLEKNNKLIAIEVKSSRAAETKGMMAFEKKYQPSKILLVGDDGLPWQDFLLTDPGSMF